MIQVTPEIQQMRERIAKMTVAGATVLPDKEEIAKVRQLLTSLSEYCRELNRS